MNKIIAIDCALIEVLTANTVLISYRNDYNIELEDAVEVNDQLLQLFSGRKICAISDFSNQFNQMAKDAQNYLAKDAEIVGKLLCSAIVINNLPTRLLARFFISFHRPIYPVKIVSNIELAKIWVEEVKQQKIKVAS